ncbi:MAG: ATPase, T2SS/T4P/T4SS family, partial [Chitinispirillaceae bacterium]|nr:ATPase, T2SS/T4P/T4SS family [Chitinispirillaceae bacterium]
MRIGEMLLRLGHITKEQHIQALRIQAEKGGKIGEILVSIGAISEDKLYETLSKQFGITLIKLNENEVIDNVIPYTVMEKYKVIPIRENGNNKLSLALSDPNRIYDLKELKMLTGYEIEPYLVKESTIDKILRGIKSKIDNEEDSLLSEFYDFKEEVDVELVEEIEKDISEAVIDAEKPPVVRIVNAIIHEAIKEKASDIHIEPEEKTLKVRYRIDGILHEKFNIKRNIKDAIISRIKVLSNLNISERRIPQDGRIKIKLKVDDKLKDVDIRVSSLPTILGEKIVMRILDKQMLMFDLQRLGFEETSLKKFEKAIHSPWGMILVTGPTGSGKTNTLYSAINILNTPDINITTVEGPVEFKIRGINQV